MGGNNDDDEEEEEGKSRKRGRSDGGEDEWKKDAKMRKVEKEAQDRVCDRVRQILQREFGRSLREKEEEAEEIERRLVQVRKALQMVRYGVVANYYSGGTLPKQTRSRPEEVFVHPAVRPLLAGKRPAGGGSAAAGEASPSSSCPPSSTAAATPTAAASSARSGAEAETEDGDREENRPGYVPANPRSNVPEVSAGVRNLSHRVKRRFVVGNVSKWIQCDQREDLSTHKWMMYVRGGDRDSPDVSDVVRKVRFLIHPSYHPHDLVDVDRPPFHLTRRGWGEFPARVQIHFRDAGDKPVDIIHHLKLDRTYTGLQTLGAETVVDVWLHDSRAVSRARERDEKVTKSEAIIDKFENAPEGLVIPHDDVSDIMQPSMLPDFHADSFPQVKVERSDGEQHAPSAEGSALEAARQQKTKMVVFKTESGQLQQQPLSSQMTARRLPNNNCPSSNCNGAASPGKTTYIRYKDKKGKKYLLPVTVLPNNHRKFVSDATANETSQVGQKAPSGANVICAKPLLASSNNKKACNGVDGDSASVLQSGPTEVVSEQKVVARANGISLVKERHFVRQKNRGSPARAGTTGGGGGGGGGAVSLLRSSSPVSSSALRQRGGGVSLLRKNNSPVAASLTSSAGITHVLSTTSAKAITPSTAKMANKTLLESAIPSVSLDQWSAILGKGNDQEDGQQEVEERLLGRSWELLKRQIGYYKLLSEVFNLRSSDFPSRESCVFRLARYLPLVSPLAKDPMYRALHPYAAPSEKVFCSWNLAKQLCSEWTRAKTISRILHNVKSLQPYATSTWEVSTLLREHGFSHFLYSVGETTEVEDIPAADRELDWCSVERLLETHKHLDEGGTVDVEGDRRGEGEVRQRGRGSTFTLKEGVTMAKKPPATTCMMLAEDSVGGLAFVREAAAEIGVHFDADEIVKGVFYPTTERLIYHACKNVCEMLVRKAYKAVRRRRFEGPSSSKASKAEVTTDDVRRAIRENGQLFDVFSSEVLAAAVRR